MEVSSIPLSGSPPLPPVGSASSINAGDGPLPSPVHYIAQPTQFSASNGVSNGIVQNKGSVQNALSAILNGRPDSSNLLALTEPLPPTKEQLQLLSRQPSPQLPRQPAPGSSNSNGIGNIGGANGPTASAVATTPSADIRSSASSTPGASPPSPASPTTGPPPPAPPLSTSLALVAAPSRPLLPPSMSVGAVATPISVSEVSSPASFSSASPPATPPPPAPATLLPLMSAAASADSDRQLVPVPAPASPAPAPPPVPGAQNYVDITEYLNLPQTEASKRLGIPTSTLSKRWKEAVVSRKWPYRTVCKLDKEIMTLLHNIPQGADAPPLPPELEASLGILLRKRQDELRTVIIRL